MAAVHPLEARLHAAGLPPEARQTLSRYVREVHGLFGSDLEAVLLYGSAARGEFVPDRSNLNLLLVLVRFAADVLRRYAKAHRRWAKEGIVVPLMLTVGELREMSTRFPLEYGELRDHHLVLAGEHRFETDPGDRERLLGQCRQEIHGNLIRLRQRFVEGGGTAEAIAILLPLSITALLAPLRGWLRALGQSPPGSSERVLEQLQRECDLDAGALLEVWRLKQASITPGAAELPRMFERYLEALGVLLAKLTPSSSSASSSSAPGQP